jgi:hypothetical protein
MNIIDIIGRVLIVIFTIVFYRRSHVSNHHTNDFLFLYFSGYLFMTMLTMALLHPKRIPRVSVSVFCILLKMIITIFLMKYTYHVTLDMEKIVYCHILVQIYRDYLNMIGLGFLHFSVYILLILYHLYNQFFFSGQIEYIYLGNLIGILLSELLYLINFVGQQFVE